MQNVVAWSGSVMQSNSDGSARKAISGPIPVLGAKSMEVYLNVTEVDSDTEIIVKWSKSADGVRWYDISSAIIDTGAGADAETKVYVGDNGSTLLGAFVRLGVTVVKRSNATLHTATLSVHAVLKPF